MTRTSTEWLALDDELGVELAKVLTEKPWKHIVKCTYSDPEQLCVCSKCKEAITNTHSEYQKGVPGRWVFTSDDPCPVPDPITIDWNTAMEWFRKMPLLHKVVAMVWVSNAALDDDEGWREDEKPEMNLWWVVFAQPKHYLIAAAMSKE